MIINKDVNEKTEGLKKSYEKLIDTFSKDLNKDNLSLSLPKFVFPFQKHYRNIMQEFIEIQDQYNKYYENELYSYKISTGNRSLCNPNATEMKVFIDKSKEGREYKKYMQELEADMNLIESMIEVLKNYNFNLNYSLKFREMVGG